MILRDIHDGYDVGVVTCDYKEVNEVSLIDCVIDWGL